MRIREEVSEAPFIPALVDVASAQDLASVQDVASAQDLAPVQDLPPVQDVAPVQDLPPVQDVAPARRRGTPLPRFGHERPRAVTYLDEMGRIPLLTPAQEVDLAKRTKAGAEAQAMLETGAPLDVAAVVELALTCECPVLSPTSESEARELCRRIAQEGSVARQQLIEANLRLVVSIARAFAGRGLPMADIIQEGNLGLIRAVDKFDWERGFKLSTYATWWIRQAIGRGLQNTARVIRLPVHKEMVVSKVARVQRELMQELGREPRMAEVAEAMGVSEEELKDLSAIGSYPLSLEAPLSGDSNATLGDVIENKAVGDPADSIISGMLRAKVGAVLGTLPEQEAEVIGLRFGFRDGEARTMTDVAKELNLSRDRIRQMERRALCRLCHPSRSKELPDSLA